MHWHRDSNLWLSGMSLSTVPVSLSLLRDDLGSMHSIPLDTFTLPWPTTLQCSVVIVTRFLAFYFNIAFCVWDTCSTYIYIGFPPSIVQTFISRPITSRFPSVSLYACWCYEDAEIQMQPTKTAQNVCIHSERPRKIKSFSLRHDAVLLYDKLATYVTTHLNVIIRDLSTALAHRQW